MAFRQTNSARFAIDVGRLLNEYSQEVAVACRVCTEETASDMVDELKQFNKGKHDWKKFPKAWTYTIQQLSWGEVRGIVHLKKPMYRIGHLLEFGHAVRTGGRAPIKEGKQTSVDGFNFIEPIADKYERIYVEKMEDMIGVVV